jgi:hypothetical protein
VTSRTKLTEHQQATRLKRVTKEMAEHWRINEDEAAEKIARLIELAKAKKTSE